MRYAILIAAAAFLAAYSMAAGNAIVLGYGQNVTVNGILVIAPSYPSHQTVNVVDGGGIIEVNNVTMISPPSAQPPPPQVVVNAINDGNTITLLANNVIIHDPPSNTVWINLTSGNQSEQGVINALPGVTIHYFVAPPNQIDNTVVLNPGNKTYIPIVNEIVYASPLHSCNISRIITPSFNKTQLVSNSVWPCNINLTIAQLPSFNSITNLSLGGSIDIHGAEVTAPSEQSLENNSAVTQFYNSYYNSNTSRFLIEPSDARAAQAQQICIAQYQRLGLVLPGSLDGLNSCIIQQNNTIAGLSQRTNVTTGLLISAQNQSGNYEDLAAVFVIIMFAEFLWGMSLFSHTKAQPPAVLSTEGHEEPEREVL
jgi:hypothetical protein